MVLGTKQTGMVLGNLTNILARASVIRKGHGLAYSLSRESSELLTRIGIGDRAVLHVRAVDRPVSFKAVARIHGQRLYIHIPKWAEEYHNHGDEVLLVITPLTVR